MDLIHRKRTNGSPYGNRIWGRGGRAIVVSIFVASSFSILANAQKSYGPGVSDTEIKIGNIMPYSGPASGYATIGKAQAAYFKKSMKREE